MLYAEKNNALISIELTDAPVFIQAGYTIYRSALYQLTSNEVNSLLGGSDKFLDANLAPQASTLSTNKTTANEVTEIDTSRISFDPVIQEIRMSRDPILHQE